MTTKEPPQLGERRIRIEREAQTPLIAMAWHTAAAPDREARVMEVLLSILGDGDSSRLYQRLVEKEQAAVRRRHALDAGFDPGLAWVYAVVPPGGDVPRTEKLIDEEIARLAKDGPTPVEITKARNQALASASGAASRPSAARRRRSASTRCSTATTASCSTRRPSTRASPPTT